MISGGFIALEKGFDPVIRSQLEVLTDRIVTFDELKMSSKFDTIMSSGPAEAAGKGKIGKYLEDLEKTEEKEPTKETAPQEEEGTPTEEPVKKPEEKDIPEETIPPEEKGTSQEEEDEETPDKPPAENTINEGEALQTATLGESGAGEQNQTLGRIGKMMQQLDEQDRS